MHKLTSQSSTWEVAIQCLLALGTMAAYLILLLARIAVPVAAVLFIVWLLCGGALWQGSPETLPAIRTLSSW